MNDVEPLSSFRAPSVKKKPTENKTVGILCYGVMLICATYVLCVD